MYPTYLYPIIILVPWINRHYCIQNSKEHDAHAYDSKTDQPIQCKIEQYRDNSENLKIVHGYKVALAHHWLYYPMRKNKAYTRLSWNHYCSYFCLPLITFVHPLMTCLFTSNQIQILQPLPYTRHHKQMALPLHQTLERRSIKKKNKELLRGSLNTENMMSCLPHALFQHQNCDYRKKVPHQYLQYIIELHSNVTKASIY